MAIERDTLLRGRKIWTKNIAHSENTKPYKTLEGKKVMVMVHSPSKVLVDKDGVITAYNRLALEQPKELKFKSKLPWIEYRFRYTRNGSSFREKIKNLKGYFK